MRHTPALALVCLGLSGCAGMSESECQFSDWRAVGYEDGARGEGTGAFGRYRKSCAEHGVTPDFSAYQSGRESGLREYCQASRGFEEGARGAIYHGVCPADSEARFLEAYNDGCTLHELESGLRDTERRMATDEARIRQIEIDLPGKMTAAMAAATSVEERARLIVETKQLAEERATLRHEIKDLQAQRALQEQELARARAEIVARR